MGRGKKKKNKGQNIAILDIISDTRVIDEEDDFIPAKALDIKKNIKNDSEIDDKNSSSTKLTYDENNKKTISNINNIEELENNSHQEITIYDKYYYITRFLNYNWHKINNYDEIEPIVIEDSDTEEDSDYYNYDEY